MSLIAINICLISSAFDAIAIPLSSTLCPVNVEDQDEDFSYGLVPLAERKLQRGYGYAHCTVMQLCARALDLKSVKEKVRDTWKRFREEMSESTESLLLDGIRDGPVFGTNKEGATVRLPNIAVSRTPALMSLHEALVAELQPLHVRVGSMEVAKAAFHKKFPVNNTVTAEWMLNFMDCNAHDKYEPHISLGSTTVEEVSQLTYIQKKEVPWRECRLVVSHMGNFCSCIELLEN